MNRRIDESVYPCLIQLIATAHDSFAYSLLDSPIDTVVAGLCDFTISTVVAPQWDLPFIPSYNFRPSDFAHLTIVTILGPIPVYRSSIFIVLAPPQVGFRRFTTYTILAPPPVLSFIAFTITVGPAGFTAPRSRG